MSDPGAPAPRRPRPAPPPSRALRGGVPPAADEVSIFIDPDGTVTICDLWEGLLPVARALGEIAPACPLPSAAAPGEPVAGAHAGGHDPEAVSAPGGGRQETGEPGDPEPR